jgi:glycosyltransferase involved in cell wall biosynthesis
MATNSKSAPMLAIVIATYNRPEKLRCLLKSIPESPDIEISIYDDGSEADYLEGLALCPINKNLVHFNRGLFNHGRAYSILEALRPITSAYVMLVDDDDELTSDGLTYVLEKLREYPSVRAHAFLTTATKIKNTSAQMYHLPYYSLRLYNGISGDLKEVVATELLKCCYPRYCPATRRIPTTLLWIRVSDFTKFRLHPKVVVNKRYHPGGMTSNIAFIKLTNPEPMRDLYRRLYTLTPRRHVYRKILNYLKYFFYRVISKWVN